MGQEDVQQGFYDFMYGKFLLKDLFDIDLNEGVYVERAYNVFRDIGNIATATHAFMGVVEEDGTIHLPCNCEFVESVSSGKVMKDEHQDFVVYYLNGSKVSQNSFLPDLLSNSRIPKYNIAKSQLHPEGEMIPYEIMGTTDKRIVVGEKFIGAEITIIYRGIVVDDDDNPCLTRKEAEAIAYRLAFIDTQRKAFKRDPEAMQMLSYIKPESEIKMAAAKIPEYISQNFIDRLLSSHTRHDRKVFSKSYKTLQ